MKNTVFAALLASATFSLNLKAAEIPTNLELDKNVKFSEEYLLQNISPKGAALGAVVASPSKSNPDYFYHWVRDGALVIDAIRHLGMVAPMPEMYYEKVQHFINFSRQNQKAPTPSGLGEPKFYADGRVFDEPWGRPQNDGPALRALTISRYLLNVDIKKAPGAVPDYLDVLSTDLDYVVENWYKSSFDLWEEVLGSHFYTRLVQVAALEIGIKVFSLYEDASRVKAYTEAYQGANQSLTEFWDENRSRIVTTSFLAGGLDYKTSGIDSAQILAINHTAEIGKKTWGHTDSRVLATFVDIVNAFAVAYPINQQGFVAHAIGRYPEDRYDGIGFEYGNPWFLTTLGFAEFLYKLAHSFVVQGSIKVDALNEDFFKMLGYKIKVGTEIASTEPLFEEVILRITNLGDDYVSRAAFHTGPNNRMFEQINNQTGFMQGASDLTWSYASHITAWLSRQELKKAL